jgi:hypothetical protein
MTIPHNLLIPIDNATYEFVLEEDRPAILDDLEKIVPSQIASSAERWEQLYVTPNSTYFVGGPNREPVDVMYRVFTQAST